MSDGAPRSELDFSISTDPDKDTGGLHRTTSSTVSTVLNEGEKARKRRGWKWSVPLASGLDQLDESIRSLPSLEARLSRSWHESVRESCLDIALSWSHFPFDRLHQITSTYLGKRKRPELVDGLLVNLIEQHDNQEHAFAACLLHLSPSAVEHALDSFFDHAVAHPRHQRSFFEACLICCRFKSSAFPETDKVFVEGLMKFINSNPTADSICPDATLFFRSLLITPPSNTFLVRRCQILVQTYCKPIAETFRSVQRWLTSTFDAPWDELNIEDVALAAGFSAALSQLKDMDNSVDIWFKSVLPHWRAWAHWVPCRERLDIWSAAPSNDRPIYRFLQLEGPDVASVSPCSQNRGFGLARGGELNGWLESNGFRVGARLTCERSTKSWHGFVNQLLRCATRALARQDGMYTQLFLLYMQKNGLDDETLEAFEFAESVWKPTFVNCLTGHWSNVMYVEALISSLQAISENCGAKTRRPFAEEIAALVQRTARTTYVKIQEALKLGMDWLIPAAELWDLFHGIGPSQWLHPFLPASIVTASKIGRPKEDLFTLRDMWNDIKNVKLVGSHLNRCMTSLILAVASGRAITCKSQAEQLEDDQICIALALYSVYKESRHSSGSSRQTLAIQMMVRSPLDSGQKATCIRDLPSLSNTLIVNLAESLYQLEYIGCWACVNLTNTIVDIAIAESENSSSWRNFLLSIMRGYSVAVNNKVFLRRGFTKYRKWINQLVVLGFGDEIGLDNSHLDWLSRLYSFEPCIEGLENLEDSNTALTTLILSGWHPVTNVWGLSILGMLKSSWEHAAKRLLDRLFITFAKDVSKLGALYSIMKLLLGFDKELTLFCGDVLSILLRGDKAAALAHLSMLLLRPDLEDDVISVLFNFGELLEISPSEYGQSSFEDLHTTIQYYHQQVANLVGKAKRLERCRFALEKEDPEGVDGLLHDLGLEEVSARDAIVAGVPPELPGDTYELLFPLNHLNSFERLAFGLNGTETLLMSLKLGEYGSFSSATVSLTTTTVTKNEETSFGHAVVALEECTDPCSPIVPVHTGPLNRTTYLVAQVVRKLLNESCDDLLSLENLYRAVQEFLHTGADRCMVCGVDVGARLHRATLCKKSDCRVAFKNVDSAVRLQDLRVNSRVVDLLLASIHATATNEGGNLELLLPNRPLAQSSTHTLLHMLNSLPPLLPPDATGDYEGTFTDDVFYFLSWVCNAYSGFLVPATEIYKIPNTPGIHQFLLVDGAPEVEAAFAKYNGFEPRQVMFHGTSMSRLYSILAQGLRVLSSSTLQRNGAARGAGIYLAKEPSYALRYSSRNNFSSFCRDSRSDFAGAKVLLGCELVGDDVTENNSSRVHVVQNPSRVMVRYVWIVPPFAQVPAAKDIRIPMLGAFSALRASRMAKLGRANLTNDIFEMQ